MKNFANELESILIQGDEGNVEQIFMSKSSIACSSLSDP